MGKKTTQQENDEAENRLKNSKLNRDIILLEFGFKQCEKGNNLEYAINEYNKLTK